MKCRYSINLLKEVPFGGHVLFVWQPDMCAINRRQNPGLNAVSEVLPRIGFSLPLYLVAQDCVLRVALVLLNLVELVLDALLRGRCSCEQERNQGY
jgi:hypothetical protein